MYNGLNVLDRIPGLVQYLNGFPREEWQFYSVLPEDLGFLGSLKHPRRHDGPDGHGTISILRHVLQRRLLEFAQTAGVEIKWGHKLESLTQDNEGVDVTFSDGSRERFSFVIGCDGLHSNTRKALFGGQPADYTGIAMVRIPMVMLAR